MASELKYKDWTVKDTCQYLEKEGLGEWISTFQKHNITGIVLQNLTVDHLKACGIASIGDCLKILHSIRKLWQVTGEGKVFNDPIHGHLELHPLLIKIIDTPQFQRLRNIKQLGGVYFVYPGASHNRFEHSIGVAYLAGELVKSLSTQQPELLITPTDILCVQIAGLCHDLGHGPFSHLFDDMFIPKAKKMKKEAEKQKEKKHETISCEMFEHLVKCNNLMLVMEKHGLNETDLHFIKEMIAGPLDSSTAQDQWPYKGRTEEKSFLYEIVSNKRNGIDVDKFDYFARDCYHLGIQNNFDYRRFLKFARVCDMTEGETRMEKQICVRDKEVHNLYNMFHTRYCIHRRACQHKVNSIIQTMIADAFVKADEHIQIEGSGGKMFTLSTAINDMEAYTKLTDCVFEQILNFPSKAQKRKRDEDEKRDEDMAEAKKILQRIISRDLYKCLGETHYENSTEPSTSKKICDDWKQELTQHLPDGLEEQDFEVTLISMDYGMKEKDPIRNVRFYTKDNPNRATEIPREQVSKLLPEYFSDQLIRFYYKKTDDTYLSAAKHFDEWSKGKGIQILKMGLRQATSEINPGENSQNN